MKAKELFKKLEAYNEVSELMDDEYRLELCFSFELERRTYTDYDEFREDVYEIFIPEVAEAIINHNYDLYNCNVVTAIKFGDKLVEEIEVYFSKTREF